MKTHERSMHSLRTYLAGASFAKKNEQRKSKTCDFFFKIHKLKVSVKVALPTRLRNAFPRGVLEQSRIGTVASSMIRIYSTTLKVTITLALHGKCIDVF